MLTCAEQTCATCHWWRRKGPRIADAIRDPSCPSDTGTCELHAPAVFQVAPTMCAPLYPTTHETRRCGDWRGKDGAGGGDGGERVVSFPSERRAA
jgi:hypothetical protein